MAEVTPCVCSPLSYSFPHVDLYVYVGDFFIPAFQCPHHVERIGVLGDGGKWVCGAERIAKQEKCVVYSFGQFLFLSFP
jgi:Methyltransferase domain